MWFLKKKKKKQLLWSVSGWGNGVVIGAKALYSPWETLQDRNVKPLKTCFLSRWNERAIGSYSVTLRSVNRLGWPSWLELTSTPTVRPAKTLHSRYGLCRCGQRSCPAHRVGYSSDESHCSLVNAGRPLRVHTRVSFYTAGLKWASFHLLTLRLNLIRTPPLTPLESFGHSRVGICNWLRSNAGVSMNWDAASTTRGRVPSDAQERSSDGPAISQSSRNRERRILERHFPKSALEKWFDINRIHPPLVEARETDIANAAFLPKS